MASLQGSQPLPRQHSSYFPPAPSSKQQPSSDMETPLKHNVFRFPLTRNILWDQTPVGPSIQLHPMHTRNISLHVSEAAVRLAHRHALQADVQPYHGFLVGSVQVDADEEGLTVSLDRFDPGRDVPGRNARLPTARLPADFIVPLTTCLGDADISATHTSEDFIAAFKLLESNINTHGSVDPSRCLTLRVLCRCHSNADDITLSLHFGAVTVATVLNGFPVKSIPIIPTALARNLMGPMSLSDVQGSYKTGFLSMDETRKLLLLLESDPKATTIPLVGIWLSGITHMSNPVVWSACLRYLNSSGIQERVCSPESGFLVVLFTHTSRQPLFYECKVKSEQEPGFMLVGCRENLHVFKYESAKGKPPVEMELTSARGGPSKSLFMQSLAQLRSSQKHPISSTRRRSSATDSMSTEESQLMPRPSPKPILDKSPSVMPSVPELSFISDSFCEPTDQRRKDQVTADVHPQHKKGHTIHRQRLNGQSDTVKGMNKQISVHRRRLHGTSKTPSQGHQQHSPGMKGTNQISRQNRPGPLRALNGQELNDNRKKGGHSSETHDMRKRASQPKDKAGKVLHTKSSGYGLHANRPRQGRHSAVDSSQQHSSESNARDRQMRPNVHGRPGIRMQHQQQSKVSFQDQVEFDIEPSPDIIADQLCHQHQSDALPVDMESVLLPHQQPGTPTGHYHSPINKHLVNTQPTLPSHSPHTLPVSISQDGQSYPETSNHHHQDNATTGGPFHPSPKTVTSHGHLHPMTTLPKEHVLSPVHGVTQKSEDVVVVQSAPSSIDRRSDAPVPRDQSQSREPSDMDIRTLEQLKRQEEMIQQLQEQIKLLLQAHSPHSTSTPLGLMTPPATPQGAQNMANEPTLSAPVHSPAETGSFHSHPVSIQPPTAATPSHRHHVRDATVPQSTAPGKCAITGVATLAVHQQVTIATSSEQSSKTPVMCSMAVNTGQSLFWSTPVDGTVSDASEMKSDQAQPKITRRSSMTTPVLSPMPDPDSTSTPVATQCGQERQSSDMQEGFTNVLQTRKVMERVDTESCQESTRKSSHSAQLSDQHTPIQSPERRSQDESSHTFGANLSSPTLGESASTYAPPHPQTSDEEGDEDEEDRRDMEKEKRTNVASPSLLYRDERKFYDNLLGQVQQLLHTDGTERTTAPNPVIAEGTTDPDLPCALPDISLATLEELEKLGINLHNKDITITDRSLYRSLYNVSPDLHPHINYVSLADFTFDPSDLSMEANAIAMKYLSDSELTKLSAGFQGDKTPGRRGVGGGGGGGVNPLLRSVLTGIRGEGSASSRGDDVDSSVGVNMSLASRKYMEKYGLLSGGEGEGAASPRGDGHLLKPSPVRFMKSPAIARTNLPRDIMKEDKRGTKARPTRLSYSPSREVDSHRTKGVELNAPNARDADLTSDPHPPNVLGNLKAQKVDKSDEDSGAKGNILDISKLKQLPKLL